jgi:hypothetical protein
MISAQHPADELPFTYAHHRLLGPASPELRCPEASGQSIN